ncbi:MAG: transposase [Candidatus Tectimicrobiota bacterium]
MVQTRIFRHERVDDIPLIIGLANKLHLAEVLDRHMGTHRLQQGWHNGQLAVGWLAYILSQADHRQSAVRDWANGLPHTLAQLLGHPIREVECSDDRLGGVLYRLSNDATWNAIEPDLWATTVTVYELALTGIRLDSTTSDGYHHVTEDGVMQRGHSTDHRPDLPQLQLMAAAAEPSGHLIACDVHPGQCADDPLYTPLLQRVRGIVGRPDLLYVGDCKMAALATRAEIAAHHDLSLMPLPLTGETATQVETWVTAIVEGTQEATLRWDGEHWLGVGYEWERPLHAMVDGQPIGWTERVQVVRSPTLAQRQQATLEKRLAAAAEELRALTPAPGRGKRQRRDEATLQAAIARVLERHEVTGLLTATWARHETTVTGYVGRGRGSADRPTRTQTQVRYALTGVRRQEEALAARRHRLGWRVQVTNAPVDRLPLAQAIQHYRGGWSLERACHLVKALPLGLQPLCVWKEEQIKGLTRLLTLALRLLTLLETQGRRGLAQAPLAGLSEGSPTRTTERPSGTRILQAFARAQLTLTRVEMGRGIAWHLTPLAPLHEQLLRHLHLPTSLYTALADNSS